MTIIYLINHSTRKLFNEVGIKMREITYTEATLEALQEDRKMLKEEVDDEDIAEVISCWTGIPVSRMLEGEREKLVHMEKRLAQRVIGQEQACRQRVRPVVATVTGEVDCAGDWQSVENRCLGGFDAGDDIGIGTPGLGVALLTEQDFTTTKLGFRIVG